MEEAKSSRIYTVFGDNRETIDCCMSIGSYEEILFGIMRFVLFCFSFLGKVKVVLSHLLSGRR